MIRKRVEDTTDDQHGQGSYKKTTCVPKQTIVELLNQAVEAANANTKHALDVAHKLSRQLRVAEERITDFEADLRHYKDRADRAEKWLNYISSEIEQKFFGSGRTSTNKA